MPPGTEVAKVQAFMDQQKVRLWSLSSKRPSRRRRRMLDCKLCSSKRQCRKELCFVISRLSTVLRNLVICLVSRLLVSKFDNRCLQTLPPPTPPTPPSSCASARAHCEYSTRTRAQLVMRSIVHPLPLALVCQVTCERYCTSAFFSQSLSFQNIIVSYLEYLWSVAKL